MNGGNEGRAGRIEEEGGMDGLGVGVNEGIRKYGSLGQTVLALDDVDFLLIDSE